MYRRPYQVLLGEWCLSTPSSVQEETGGVPMWKVSPSLVGRMCACLREKKTVRIVQNETTHDSHNSIPLRWFLVFRIDRISHPFQSDIDVAFFVFLIDSFLELYYIVLISLSLLILILNSINFVLF